MDSIWEDEKNCNPGELLEKAKTIKDGAVSLINTMKSMLDEVTDSFLETEDSYIEMLDSYKEVNDAYDEDKEYTIRDTYHKTLEEHIDIVEKAEKSFDYEKKRSNTSKSLKELSLIEESFNKSLISIEKDIIEVTLKNITEKSVLEKSKKLWTIAKEVEEKVTNYINIIEPLITFRTSWNEKFDTQTIINEIEGDIFKSDTRWNNGVFVVWIILLILLIATTGIGCGIFISIFFGIFLLFLLK